MQEASAEAFHAANQKQFDDGRERYLWFPGITEHWVAPRWRARLDAAGAALLAATAGSEAARRLEELARRRG